MHHKTDINEITDALKKFLPQEKAIDYYKEITHRTTATSLVY